MSGSQERVLDAIREIGQDGWPVTIREIMRVTGHASPSTVQAHLESLEEAGLVERNPRGNSGVRIAAT